MTSQTPEPLRGLPVVLPFEAPASWISRAAQSQGVGAAIFLRFLRMSLDLDVDFHFLSRRFQGFATACGLDSKAFAEARKVMSTLRKVDAKGQGFLFRSGRSARYRFCPRCMAGQRTPHFTLQSRLEAWRCCPGHGCMMEDGCWRCGAAIELPFSPGIDGSRQSHCHSLAQCQCCGANHRNAPVASLEEASARFSDFELLVLSNGSSVPAALFQGRVVVAGDRAYSILHLQQLWKRGMLARPGYGPTATRLRARSDAAATAKNALPRLARVEGTASPAPADDCC